MSVRVKILLVLALVFAAFSGSNYWVQESILVPKFTELEREKSSSLMESCKGAVLREIEALATTAHDWGNWDPLYQYAADRNQQFIADNVSVSNLESAHLDLIVISGLHGEMIFKLIRPLPAAQMRALEVAVPETITASQSQLRAGSSVVQGIYMTGTGPLFLAAQPITNNDGSAPSRGTLIMGRFFTHELGQDLSKQTHVPFEYYDLLNGSVPYEGRSAIARIGDNTTVDTWDIDATHLRASELLRDIAGRPALLLTADLPRDITDRGQEAVRYAQISLLASAVVFLIAILFAIERVVLARLERLSSAVGSIGHDGFNATNVKVDGVADEVGALGRDINHMLDRLHDADTSLRTSESRFRALTELSPVGIFQTDLHGSATFVNERWQRMSGLRAADAIGQGWMRALHPDDLQTVLSHWTEAVNASSEFKLEYRYRKPSGETVWVAGQAVPLRDESGAVTGFIGTVTDVSALKEVEVRLQRLALYDALTGLPNRVLLLDRMEKALSKTHRRPPYQFATMMLDLDGFKKVNDTLGHEAGDQVLVEVGARINAALRPGDTAARMGGDEFAVLLMNLPNKEATEQISQRIIERVNQPIQIGDVEVQVGVSIGFALATSDYENPDALLRDADKAMFQAKAAGKNQYRAFQTEKPAERRLSGRPSARPSVTPSWVQ
ncbi:MAG TPA: diguanylate cyclase [Polyangiaceae bacterium]|nr:diguanylate cyclase [Polyangiaceae bacterium]